MAITKEDLVRLAAIASLKCNVVNKLAENVDLGLTPEGRVERNLQPLDPAYQKAASEHHEAEILYQAALRQYAAQMQKPGESASFDAAVKGA